MSYTLTDSPQVILDDAYSTLFNPEWDPLSGDDLINRGVAFENIVTSIAIRHRIDPADVHFDYLGLRAMLGRFGRDAFGVHRVKSTINAAVAAGKLDHAAGSEIWSAVANSGIRINSEKPRKTRIAAAFSLWMATFRPISLNMCVLEKQPKAPLFPAIVNFTIANTYLSKFGSFILENTDQHDEIVDRIFHDLTYRAVSLSSLEMLYCGVFRSRVD